jgi:hypothetical protein
VESTTVATLACLVLSFPRTELLRSAQLDVNSEGCWEKDCCFHHSTTVTAEASLPGSSLCGVLGIPRRGCGPNPETSNLFCSLALGEPSFYSPGQAAYRQGQAVTVLRLGAGAWKNCLEIVIARCQNSSSIRQFYISIILVAHMKSGGVM